jgi:hypothetical protein
MECYGRRRQNIIFQKKQVWGWKKKLSDTHAYESLKEKEKLYE